MYVPLKCKGLYRLDCQYSPHFHELDLNQYYRGDSILHNHTGSEGHGDSVRYVCLDNLKLCLAK